MKDFEMVKNAYPSTGAWPWAGVSDSVVPLFLRRRSLAVLKELAVRLEGRNDVELGCTFARPRTDGATVYHEARTI